MEKMIEIAPEKIQAENNIRYAITPADRQEMIDQILAQGGVTTPVEVEKLTPPVNGFEYSLTAGFRRHSAALEINKTGGGLLIPAIVRPLGGDQTLRLKHQLSENIDRKNLSPMDQAAALKALLAAGLSNLQVREMFKRPSSKKGEISQPASPAWLKMTLSFLDLPKSIRDKIHTGQIGVAAAYEVTRVPPEKQAEVVAAAEAARLSAIEKEDKETEKYLKAEAAVAETVKQEEDVTAKLDLTQAEIELAQVDYEAKHEAAVKAYADTKKAKPEDRKAAKEHHKAAEADEKGARHKLTAAQNELAKLTAAKLTLESQSAKLKIQLADQRRIGREGRAGRGGGEALNVKEVKAAAKSAGANTGNVRLTAAEMRSVVDTLSLAGTNPRVMAVGLALKECFEGIITDGQLLKKLTLLLGKPEAIKPVKAAKAE